VNSDTATDKEPKDGRNGSSILAEMRAKPRLGSLSRRRGYRGKMREPHCVGTGSLVRQCVEGSELYQAFLSREEEKTRNA